MLEYIIVGIPAVITAIILGAAVIAELTDPARKGQRFRAPSFGSDDN